MNLLATWMSRLVEALLHPLDRLPEPLALALFSALSGVVLVLAFRRLTDARGIATARDRMASAVYEVRLFVDSPARILAAQVRLVRWSFVYLARTLPVFLVLTAPVALFYGHLDARYGLAPAGTSDVLVRLAVAEGKDPRAIGLEGTDVEQTAPPVFVGTTRELYFRVRALRPEAASLRFTTTPPIEKALTASPRARRVDAERARGVSAFAAIGAEEPLPEGSVVDDIRVLHAPREVSLLGLRAPWWVHWLVISSLVALALAKRLRVVF